MTYHIPYKITWDRHETMNSNYIMSQTLWSLCMLSRSRSKGQSRELEKMNNNTRVSPHPAFPSRSSQGRYDMSPNVTNTRSKTYSGSEISRTYNEEYKKVQDLIKKYQLDTNDILTTWTPNKMSLKTIWIRSHWVIVDQEGVGRIPGCTHGLHSWKFLQPLSSREGERSIRRDKDFEMYTRVRE